jgi:predicted AlkP superfamily pyrophosphatase or phosphodiesterase
MSGATPAMNGIVGNEWHDRDSGKRVTSVSDDKTKLLGGREGATGMSPHRPWEGFTESPPPLRGRR